MVDLDGTLFDTKETNYLAYQEAIEQYGFHMDFKYYCEYCNGRHYLDFLPQITTTDENILSAMHQMKKSAYSKYLGEARLNRALADLLKALKQEYRIALVTTASKENTYDILSRFDLLELFDLILTHDDVKRSKPDPEGYRKAMKYFDAKPEECIIFEDADVGIEAAERAGVQCFVVKGYN
jgi:beta-phosphoglucomutase